MKQGFDTTGGLPTAIQGNHSETIRINNAKGIQMKEERFKEIMRENKILMAKLEQVHTRKNVTIDESYVDFRYRRTSPFRKTNSIS